MLINYKQNGNKTHSMIDTNGRETKALRRRYLKFHRFGVVFFLSILLIVDLICFQSLLKYFHFFLLYLWFFVRHVFYSVFFVAALLFANDTSQQSRASSRMRIAPSNYIYTVSADTLQSFFFILLLLTWVDFTTILLAFFPCDLARLSLLFVGHILHR